jgi:hypothetical protein
MKVTIKDREVLQALDSEAVADYLLAYGWKQVEQIGDKGTAWKLCAEQNREYEILLPLRRTVGDYVLRMADILRTLEVAEQRSQLDIWNDIEQITERGPHTNGAEDSAAMPLRGIPVA